MKKLAAVLLGSAAVTLASTAGTGTASADPITDAVGPALHIPPARTAHDDDRRSQMAGMGAGIGALAGGATGSYFGSLSGAGVGAAAGAAAGAALGYGEAVNTEHRR